MTSQFLKLPNQRSERRHSTPVLYTSSATTASGSNANQQLNDQQQEQQQQQRYSRSSDDIEIPLLNGSPTFFNGRLFPFLDRNKHHHNNSKTMSEKSSPTFAHRILKMKPKSSSVQQQQHQDGAITGAGGVGGEKLKMKRGGSVKKRSTKHTDS